MGRKIYKDKYYTHLDVKKHHKDYQQRVQNINWVSRHGFYPFIHFKMDCSKYTVIENGKKISKTCNLQTYREYPESISQSSIKKARQYYLHRHYSSQTTLHSSGVTSHNPASTKRPSYPRSSSKLGQCMPV